ncbi:MAG: cobalt-precorrin 5A hydrolase [Clostridia bacterium]|nr:cobalt-precorrin 5A hydrolase [Clostridia bacterium]
MNICMFCFSDSGAKLALKLCETLGILPENVHTIHKFAEKYGFTAHRSVCADMKTLFENNDALIFIGACGIAVRDIAPHLKSKTTDPAVIVIDDRGRYVIPVLSGHIGGANALAEHIAAELGAIPVITTATDGAGRFSCDKWAVESGCVISSMKLAKDVSAEILTRDVPVSSEFELPDGSGLPDGLVNKNEGELGIYIGIRTAEPYKKTLRLIPKIVTLGIGCRRGIPAEAILSAVENVLDANGIDVRAVREIATIDVKKEEQAIIDLGLKLKVPVNYYTAAELNAVPGEFAESEFVRRTVGTGNVCERAAVCGGGRLIVNKTAENGVTVAASMADWRVVF